MSLVEAIARALHKADAYPLEQARACLETIAREGYVVVPKEPTEVDIRSGEFQRRLLGLFAEAPASPKQE